MSYYDQLKRLKHTRFLYALFMTIRKQINEKQLDPNKIYTIKLKGDMINTLYAITKKGFKDTENLQRLGF